MDCNAEQTMSREELDDVAARRGYARGSEQFRLGQILVASGQISERQLTEALERKQGTGRRIGEELVASGYLSGELLARTLRVQRRLVIAAMFAGLFPASRPLMGQAEAADARAYMTVTATVVDTVSIRTMHQAQSLMVTPQDVARGYVDVSAGSRFEITHRGPCLFEFRPLGTIFRAVKVSGVEGGAEFGSEGGTMLQKSSAGGSAPVAINYRFQLAPGVSAGAYSWPLSLTVLPI